MGCDSSQNIKEDSSLSNQPYLTLNSKHKIPQYGLGVYQIEGDEATEKACLEAFKIGIRHIDTAHAYQNERGVGAAIKKSNIPREKLFITSKLWVSDYGEGITLKAIDKMLERLGLEYLDLLLLHQQVGEYLAAYKEMEKAVELGKVKSIGISNFDENLDDLLNNCKIKPAVIQVECHPYWSQDDLRKKVGKFGTIIESWYPIGHGDKTLIDNEIFTKLGKKYNKSNVQIILRWHIQKGNVVFPKSSNPKHIKENSEIFDFKLTKEEMDEIDKLGKSKRFFTMPLEDQEKNFTNWKPAD
jgi:diketogulonate reductase-like aldo/keto reductase